MTTKNQRTGEHHFMQETIEPVQFNHEHANEQTSLLKVREDILNAAQVRLDTENKIFWLQVFAMFVFIYASTCSKQNTGVDLAFFVGIMMAIPICAKQTGANLNPAVSYSMVVKNNASSTYYLLWIYFKAQVLGAILSMVIAVFLNDIYRSPLPLVEHTFGQVMRMIVSQAVGVFTLIFFVLYATGPVSFIQNNGAKYFYIAVFVYIGRRFAAASGNQINLALTISQAFVGIPQCNYQGFKYLFVWLIGDALGVLAAAQFYNNIIEPTVKYIQKRNKARQQHRLLQQSATQLKAMPRKY